MSHSSHTLSVPFSTVCVWFIIVKSEHHPISCAHTIAKPSFRMWNNVHRPELLACMQASKRQRLTQTQIARSFRVFSHRCISCVNYIRQTKSDWFVGLFACWNCVCLSMCERVFFCSIRWFYYYSFDLFVCLFICAIAHRVSIIHNNVRNWAFHTYCNEWMK